MRLPRSYTKPGGYRVVVKLVSPETIRALNGNYEHGPKASYSLWVWDQDDGGTIYLDRTRTLKQRAADFEHEDGHAQTEWRTWWRRRAGLFD